MLDFEIRPLTDFEELKKLDFTDEESDLLGVHDFAQTKALSYHGNKISTVWGINYQGKLVGFFAVSMFSIQTKKLEMKEKVSDASSIYSYPAVLLGQLGVDKKYRSKGIGKKIVTFCVGLSQEIGQKIACRYVVLQTSEKKTGLYDEMKFIQSSKHEGKVWMYRRIF